MWNFMRMILLKAVVPKIRSLEKSFSMILRLEMILSIMSYKKKKKHFFYARSFKFTKIFSTTLLISILKVNFLVTKIVKRMF